ncbi:MAG: VCBS repeat-containing protein [Planctomycetota bacterium]
MPVRPSLTVCCSLLSFASLVAQESKALLHAPLMVLPSGSAPVQQLLDLDGDGDLDAIGTRLHGNGVDGRLHAWRNDGGALTQVSEDFCQLGEQYGSDADVLAVAIGDLDGDGLVDFAVAGGDVVRRYRSLGNFQFATSDLPLTMPHAGTRAVAIGDFDGDGQQDIAVACDQVDTTNGTLDVFVGGGGVVSTALPVLFTSEVALQAIDVDGDGTDELLFWDRVRPQAHLIALVGGQLTTQQVLSSSFSGTSGPAGYRVSWVAGDVDGDADVDIVCSRVDAAPGSAGEYRLFRQTTPMVFVADPVAAGGPIERLVDLDGDGDLDGVTCRGKFPGSGWPTLWFDSTYELTENRGGGDFAPAWVCFSIGAGQVGGAADLDGDGDVDLVGGCTIFYGDGPWNAHPMPVAGGVDPTHTLRGYQLRDFDGDGDVDIGTIALNDGGGAHAPRLQTVTPPAGHAFEGMIPIDVDSDGALDFVTRLVTAAPQPAFVQMVWLRNNGGGQLSYAGAVAAVVVGGGAAYGVDDYFAADFDGDGDEDLYWTHLGRLYWNQGGSFSAPTATPLGTVLQVADVDGDGLPDVISGSPNQALAVSLGTGQANAPFSYHITWGGWLLERSGVAVGDVDDDGDLDLVTAANNGQLTLMLNNGAAGAGLVFTVVGVHGMWQLSPVYSALPGRPTVTVADFDGNGTTDIALGRLAGVANGGAVLLRTSWSNPPSLADYQVSLQAFRDGFAADVDGDGAPDLVGSKVARNRRWSRAAAGASVQRHLPDPGEGHEQPLLGATGPFRVGETEVLRLRNVTGPTVAVLGISLGEAQQVDVPLPGLVLYLDLATTIIGSWAITEDGEGIRAASASLPIFLPNGLQGWRFYEQAFVLDPAAPVGVRQSNLLVKTIGG